MRDLEPGELPPDGVVAQRAARRGWAGLLLGSGVPSDWVWEPWLSGLLFAVVWTAIGLLLYPGRSVLASLLIALSVGLYFALTAEAARRWRLSGRGPLPGLRVAVFVVAVALVLAVQDRTQDDVDYDLLCREATARATTPADLVGVQRRIEGQFARPDGNHIPQGDQVAKFSAAAKLSFEAKEVAAPYQLPEYLRGNLPLIPDTTRVRALQAELAVACRPRRSERAGGGQGVEMVSSPVTAS